MEPVEAWQPYLRLRLQLYLRRAKRLNASRHRKWVFTLNSEIDGFDEIIKGAALSAKRHTSLKPVAVAAGQNPFASPSVTWLKCKGVDIIPHNPAWADSLKAGQHFMMQKSVDLVSPLYFDVRKMIGVFLRLDLAILGFIDDCILYTDVDAVLMRDITNA